MYSIISIRGRPRDSSLYIYSLFIVIHFTFVYIYVKYNMYNNKPVRAYIPTDLWIHSSVISGRSKKSEDIQEKYQEKKKIIIDPRTPRVGDRE